MLTLDETTSDLDPSGRRDLNKLLQSVPGTKFITTHDWNWWWISAPGPEEAYNLLRRHFLQPFSSFQT